MFRIEVIQFSPLSNDEFVCESFLVPQKEIFAQMAKVRSRLGIAQTVRFVSESK